MKRKVLYSRKPTPESPLTPKGRPKKSSELQAVVAGSQFASAAFAHTLGLPSALV